MPVRIQVSSAARFRILDQFGEEGDEVGVADMMFGGRLEVSRLELVLGADVDVVDDSFPVLIVVHGVELTVMHGGHLVGADTSGVLDLISLVVDGILDSRTGDKLAKVEEGDGPTLLG